MDMGEMPAESWWKLITPKEMRAGMNQLNGRKILILDFVSSDMVQTQQFNNALNIPFSRECLVRLPI